jgi:glutathione S-transferase
MLTIHGVPVSVHTRKVLVAANEKGLEYKNEPVIPFAPPPGWAKLSPSGKIPVAQAGELVLRDSSIICAWLEREHPERPLYPSGAAAWAQALWLEEYADSVLFPQVVHGLFFQKVIRPKILGEPTDAAAVGAIEREALPRAFGYLEGALEGDWLAGSSWSLADAAVASNLVNFHYLGYRIDADLFPKLARHFRAQIRRPSVARALAAEKAAAEGMGLDRGFLN